MSIVFCLFYVHVKIVICPPLSTTAISQENKKKCFASIDLYNRLIKPFFKLKKPQTKTQDYVFSRFIKNSLYLKHLNLSSLIFYYLIIFPDFPKKKFSLNLDEWYSYFKGPEIHFGHAHNNLPKFHLVKDIDF